MKIIENIDNYIAEANKGGLNKYFIKFHTSLMKEMQKELTAALKKGAFKVTWTSNMLTSGYAFSMKGYTRSDLEADIRVNFWEKSWMPSTYHMVLSIKTVDSLESDFWDKDEQFVDYDPKKYAKLFQQYLGF